MIEETRRCPYCDELIRFNAVKCKHCGSIISESDNVSGAGITPETQVKIALSFKYEIQEVIGRGGMASVYKAVQKNLNRPVALKVIHQNLIYDNEFLQRFHQEAQLCAALSHPNIITIYDEGAVNNIHFMAMEYLSGNDLQRIIKFTKKIVVEDAIRMIISVANALDYAHAKGLIHRDIKSANIFITNEGRTVLTDFGIAFAANSRKLTQTGSVIGTPEYMSPEQAKGVTTDGRSDIYSLGVVLYECLTGTVPFSGDNPLTTIYKILNDRPLPVKEINKDVPHWLSTIVSKALEKDPQKRFQTGKEFASALMNRKAVIIELINKKKGSDNHLVKREPNKIARHTNTKNKWKFFFSGLILFFTLIISTYYIMKKPEPEKLEILLNKANELMNRGNFVTPEGNNALMYFTEALSIESKNHEALSGLEKIKNDFVFRAGEKYNLGETAKDSLSYENAILIADSGLIYFEDYPVFMEIKSKCIASLKELEEKGGGGTPPPPPPPVIEIPNVIGLQQFVAENILRVNGLRVSVNKIFSAQKGQVINQFPGEGTSAKKGASVNIIVGE